MKRFLLLGAAGLGLAACSNNPLVSTYSEAGAAVDGGSFGNATMNNTQIHSGEKQFVIDLANKFAAKVPTTVNFEFNSTQLDGAARATLDQQAAFIRHYPEVRFRVYGHTDAVGSDAYNQQLGLRRAHMVVNYLVSRGISRSRLEAMVSYGERQPLIVSQGRERRNRRTVTEVSGFVQSHPIIMDGKYAEVVYREYIASAEPASTLVMTQQATTLQQE
ncbi:MAG: OmpA family protein [Roseovarius sp.]